MDVRSCHSVGVSWSGKGYDVNGLAAGALGTLSDAGPMSVPRLGPNHNVTSRAREAAAATQYGRTSSWDQTSAEARKSKNMRSAFL